MTRGLTAALWLVAMAACGDEEKGKVRVQDYDGGDWPDANLAGPNRPRDAASDAPNDAGDASDGATSGAPPSVRITNLTAVADPLVGPVLTGSALDVKCAVEQDAKGEPVDPASVKAAIYGAGPEAIAQVGLVLQADGVYGAALPLSAVPSGAVRVQCMAADVNAMTPAIGLDEVTTYYDGGPKITVSRPLANSAVPRGKNTDADFSIQFDVEPQLLGTAADPQADVDLSSVKLRVHDVDVALTRDANNKTFSAQIDFSVLPSTATIKVLEIAIVAANKRQPTVATATNKYTVQIDGEPPLIANIKPDPESIVGAIADVTMTITDDLSGVKPNVRAEISGKTYALELNKDVPSQYFFSFPASDFAGESNVPINIVASDNAGNESRKAFGLKFDTVAPYVSLVNQQVRVNLKNTSSYSQAFPVLGASPADESIVGSDVLIRALVWERGVPYRTTWISGVREGSVALYAQSDPNATFLKDTDGDGLCDAVEEQPTDGAKPVKHAFEPVTIGGNVPPTIESELSADPSVTGLPIPGDPVPTKCNSDMYYNIPGSTTDRPPAIYAREPKGDYCTGTAFNLGTKGGWTCLVAVAKDNAGAQGNLGISKPIRVCRDVGTPSPCPPGSKPPETMTCMKGCTLSADVTTRPTGIRISVQ